MLFIGFFICFYGHRFFRVSLFFSGFLTGAFLTYIALVAGYALPFEGELTPYSTAKSDLTLQIAPLQHAVLA